MNQEKTPGGNRGQRKSLRTPNNKKTLSERRGRCNSISLYAQGASLYVQPIVAGNGGKRGDRGEIKGWSSASRRRMREFMLTHRPADGLPLYGVTLTIPGPVMPPERAKRIFSNFARSFEKEGACAVWRLEIQQRGQLHWHMMAGTRHPGDITLLWWDTIRNEGPEVFPSPHVVGTMEITSCASRMALPGADLRSCHIDSEGDRGSWLRYLQDHVSKGKQEQIAVNIGRHWGVIGRKRFVEIMPEKSVNLDDRQFFRALRVMQRLATPSESAAGVPFGRRLRGRVRRGSRGRSIWYSRPDTIKRIVEWAMSATSERPAVAAALRVFGGRVVHVEKASSV